jgi:hypothetical protein
MTPSNPKKPSPFTPRLTFEERARLESEAGSLPLGAYIKLTLLSGEKPQSTACGPVALSRIKKPSGSSSPCWAGAAGEQPEPTRPCGKHGLPSGHA